jgi:hypothetical protein
MEEEKSPKDLQSFCRAKMSVENYLMVLKFRTCFQARGIDLPVLSHHTKKESMESGDETRYILFTTSSLYGIERPTAVSQERFHYTHSLSRHGGKEKILSLLPDLNLGCPARSHSLY